MDARDDIPDELGPLSAQSASSRTPERVRAWLDALAQFSNKIPPLPDIISREWIYQDHN